MLLSVIDGFIGNYCNGPELVAVKNYLFSVHLVRESHKFGKALTTAYCDPLQIYRQLLNTTGIMLPGFYGNGIKEIYESGYKDSLGLNVVTVVVMHETCTVKDC